MSGDRQIALLRGINVGRAKRIAMADLRALFVELGYHEVRTLLNSGNVVFTDPAGAPGDAAARIEAAIGSRLGVSTRVTVITGAELTTVVTQNPLASVADNPSRLLVAFLRDPAEITRLKTLKERDWAPEAFALGSRVAYLWCPAGLLASRLPEEIERTLRDRVTSRNWATVTKLEALAHDHG